jgi:type VI secretion system secreted protein VgrG
MPEWTRDDALLTMTSPLGPDVLLPVALSGHETISQPFTFQVRMVSARTTIDPDDMLNKPACVALQSGGTPVRYFHGIVQEFSAEGAAGRGIYAYNATLVPRLWFLGQTIDCRVYQTMSVADILAQLFTDAGVEKSQLTITGDKPQREYTVQFNETDLQFATRLMEEEGYFYFFQHAADGHTLIVANANTAFQSLPHPKLAYGGSVQGDNILTSWVRPRATVHGKVMLKDYDPTTPSKQLKSEQPTTLKTGGAPARDVFQWPALNFDTDGVKAQAQRRIEAAEAAAELASGAGEYGELVAGAKFVLEHDPLSGAEGVEFVLRSVAHHATDDSWISNGAPPAYSNSFTAFPAKVPWRQPITVPRPRMDGIYAAIVLGPDGEEIYFDEYGRVKVQFFWDHRQEATAAKSCWARVIQPWGGNGWGTMFVPRVGTEVAVAFMDGDPDRPVVVGGLYNGQDKPIYKKDDDKTKSGWRSRSSTGGGADDFNELTFDDKAGSEQIFVHAQKDFLTEVEHDQTLKVDNCRIVQVKKDETIGIDGKHDLTIGKGRTTTIKQGGDSLTVKLGDLTVKVSSGAISCEAMTSIELKVGENSVKIDPSGVSIKGTMVKIEGQAMTDIKAPMTKVGGDGMLMLKGGIMMLN